MGIELPEGFDGADKINAKFSTVEGLAKSYMELEKKLGTMLPTPTSEESKLELFKRLGAKDDPEGYTIPAGVDPEAVKEFRDFAVKARLTQEQFNRLAEQAQATAVKKDQAKGAVADKVRAQYGDKFEEASARVARVLQGMGDEAKNYDASDPTVFGLLEKLGSSLKLGEKPKTAPSSTPAPIDSFDAHAVAAEARKILSSPAYSDRNHAEHETAKEEYGKRVWKLAQKGFNGAYDDRLVPKPWSM